MAKKTLLNRLQQPVHPVLSIILIGLVVISGLIVLVLRSNQNSLPQQNQFQANSTSTPPPTDIPTITPTPTPLPHTTFTSSKLGISFTYIPYFPATSTTGMHFYTKEIGNTVYLYYNPSSNQQFSGTDAEFLNTIPGHGYFVEVLNKDPQQSLIDAIKQKVLTGYSETDCLVKPTRYGHPREDESFQTAMIDIPHDPNLSRTEVDALISKCPKGYVAVFGINYFAMDPKHTNKLLFVNIGQSNVPSGVGSMWDGTIKVLE